MARRSKPDDGRPPGSKERRTRSGTPWTPRRRLRIARLQRPGLPELPQRIVEMMGTMSDRQLADLAGVHPNTIHHERRRRGIAPFQPMSPPVRWTAAMVRTLGTDTDRAVAAELGVKPTAVARKRRSLGIAPYTNRYLRPSRLAHPWAPEELGRLGKVSDRALAKEIGLSTSAVQSKRQSLGIPPWRPRPKPVAWSRAMLGLLGEVPDMEIARRFSIASSTVLQKRRKLGIPPVMDRRPVERTPELEQVLRLPQKRGPAPHRLNPQTIAALKEETGVRGLRASEMRYSPEVVARMGREPDGVIAADIGASDSAVRQKRHSLGIPAYDGHRRRGAKSGATAGDARRPASKS